MVPFPHSHHGEHESHLSHKVHINDQIGATGIATLPSISMDAYREFLGHSQTLGDTSVRYGPFSCQTSCFR